MTTQLDTTVLIAGAGPAGSVCGYLLHRAGVPCIVIDHATFPRDKICGGGLTPKAWRLLDELLPGVSYDYNAVTRVRLDIDGHRGCEFDAAVPIRITQRRQLDYQLLTFYLQTGGAFLKDGLQTVEERRDGTIAVQTKQGRTITCRYLVGADGSNSMVRRYLTGRRDTGILAMEQYVEQRGDNSIDVELSNKYEVGGYFFRFPNRQHDVVGYGDVRTTRDKFRRVLSDKGYPDGKVRGAYIYLSNDYPLNDHILLIGDAGGFANRTTCEGLYDAFTTARNAMLAITTGRPFSEVNRHIFRKMKREVLVTKVFFSRPALFVLRQMCRCPRLVKACFDYKMQHE
ncbi:MAG: FAD-dependent monooxygenase [Prevotella sp.]|nr:FAD-dependent monooxygenase [Prevotella sp.]